MSQPRRHLAINLVQLLPEFSGGIEVYAHELIPRLADRLEGWRISAIVNREGAREYPADWDDRIEWHVASFSWHNGIRRLFAESTVVPRMVRGLKPEVLHNMTNTACLRPGCPQVTTIFDATQILEPARSLRSLAFRKVLHAAPRRSDQIVTISDSAAADIARAFGVERSQIAAIPLAARPQETPLSREETERRFGLAPGSRWFLTPASRRLNKNIPALLRAYAQLPRDERPALVLAGADGGFDDDLNALIATLGIAPDVKLPGWVTDAELDSLYTHALALVFPSLMEGFGLPILEAMQCGCPVATSEISSMPEVGGDAAVYFDPRDERSITSALAQIAGDADLRARLSEQGRGRAAEFSWIRTAQETADIYLDLLEGTGGPPLPTEA